MTLNRFRFAFRFGLGCAIALTACSTTQVVEQKAPLPVVPEYVKIPHPAGFDLADLRALLASPLAPKAVTGEFADTCDEDFQKLLAATNQKEEHDLGANELVTADPSRMHWCFYAKISRLEDVLQTDSTWSERKKKILESFSFLSPIANAFSVTYHDSRYLRWASQYYSKVSEWVFFKKLEPTPDSTLTLTNDAHPAQETWMGVQRDESNPNSVFARFGISFQPTVAAAVNPLEVQVRKPAAAITAPSIKSASVLPVDGDAMPIPAKASPALNPELDPALAK
jgi:hypothetical protein